MSCRNQHFGVSTCWSICWEELSGRHLAWKKNPVSAFAMPCRLLCSEYIANCFVSHLLFPAFLKLFDILKVGEGKICSNHGSRDLELEGQQSAYFVLQLFFFLQINRLSIFCCSVHILMSFLLSFVRYFSVVSLLWSCILKVYFL